MKRVFLACMMVSVAVAVSASTVTYTADNTSIFPNPERGFITMIGGNLSESNPYGVKGQESNLDNHKQKDKISIVLVHYYLSNYRTKETIPDKVLNAFDEDMILSRAQTANNTATPTDEQIQAAQREMIREAVEPFQHPEVREYIENVRRSHDQIMDDVNLDTVLFAGFDTDKEANADEVIMTFREFIDENKDDEI